MTTDISIIKTGLVKISTADAIKAAANALQLYYDTKAERKQNAIEELSQSAVKSKKLVFCKSFPFVKIEKEFYSIEEVKNLVETPYDTLDYGHFLKHYVKWQYENSGTVDFCKTITDAAEMSKDGYIYVGLECARYLKSHLD